MHFSANVTVAAPIGQVFSYLDDEERMKRWMTGLVEVSYEQPAVPRGVGSRFRRRIKEQGRIRDYEGEVIRYRPPAEIGVRLGNTGFSVDVGYRLVERSGTTQVQQTVVMAARSRLTRVVSRLSGWLMQRQQQSMLLRLKAVVERDRAVSGG
jgi:uncharacterized protein YndB with AHSA1/START domain